MSKARIWARILITLGCLYSVIYFWILNSRLTSTPERSEFRGGVEVLYEGSGLEGPPVRSLLTVSHNLTSSQPNRVRVVLVSCGKMPSLDGVLVFSGDARLSRVTQWGIDGSEPTAFESRGLSAAGQSLTTPPLEFFRFHLEDIPPCITPEKGQGPVPFGAALEIDGYARSPVVESSGVRHWLAPPLVGDISGVPSGMLGVFNLDGKSGNYYRNVDRSNEIQYQVPAQFNKDFVQPDPIDPGASTGSLEWREKKATATAHALVVDADEQQSTQNSVVLWSIIFGITGSLLASMVWQLVFDSTSDRAHSSATATGDDVNAQPTARTANSDSVASETTVRDALIVTAFLALRIVTSRPKRKPKTG